MAKRFCGLERRTWMIPFSARLVLLLQLLMVLHASVSFALDQCAPLEGTYTLPPVLPALLPRDGDVAISQCAAQDGEFYAGQSRLASKQGNVIVGGLFPMRRLRGSDGSATDNVTCRVDSTQVFPATLVTLLAVWRYLEQVTDIGRAADGSPLTVGYDLRDSCSSVLCGAREAYTLSEYSLLSRCGYDTRFPSVCRLPSLSVSGRPGCGNVKELDKLLAVNDVAAFRPRLPPASFILGPFHGHVQQAISTILRVFAVPAVTLNLETADSADAALGGWLLSPAVTTPTEIAVAVADVLRAFGWTYIAVVTEEGNYFMDAVRTVLTTALAGTDVCITVDEHVTRGDSETARLSTRDTVEILRLRHRVAVVVLLAGQEVATATLDALRDSGVRPLVFVGVETWIANRHVLEHAAVASLLMISRQATAAGRRRASDVMSDIIDGVQDLPREMYPYWSRIFNCSLCANDSLPQGPVDVNENAAATTRTTRESVTLGTQCAPLVDDCEASDGSLAPCTMDEIRRLMSSSEVRLLSDYVLPPMMDALAVTEQAIRRTLAEYSRLLLTGNYAMALPTQSSLRILAEALANHSALIRPSPLLLSNLQPVLVPAVASASVGEGRLEKQLVEVGDWRRLGDGNLALVWRDDARLHWGVRASQGGRPPVSKCSDPCPLGTSATIINAADACCWNCTVCGTHQVRSSSRDVSCSQCAEHSMADAGHARCLRLPLDYAGLSSAVAVLCLVLVMVCAVLFLATLVVYVACRSSPVIRASDFKLSMVFIGSLFVGVLAQGTFILRPDHVVPCGYKPPLTYVWQVACFSAMLIKTRRMASIFSLSLRQLVTTSHHVHNFQQVLFVAVLTLFGLILSMTWVLTNPPVAVEEVVTPHQKVILYCSTNVPWVLGLASYLSLLNVLTLVLAYKTRKIPDNYNEAGFLFLASFISNFLSIAVLPAYFATSDETIRPLQLCLFSTLTLLTLWACVCLPRVYRLLLEHRGKSPGRRGMGTLARLTSFRRHHASAVTADRRDGGGPGSECGADGTFEEKPFAERRAYRLERSMESLITQATCHDDVDDSPEPEDSPRLATSQRRLYTDAGRDEVDGDVIGDFPAHQLGQPSPDLPGSDAPSPTGAGDAKPVLPCLLADSDATATSLDHVPTVKRLRQESCPADIMCSVSRSRAMSAKTTTATTAATTTGSNTNIGDVTLNVVARERGRRRSTSAMALGSKEANVWSVSSESSDGSVSLWQQLKEWAGFGELAPSGILEDGMALPT